jgi:type I restriction enzyme S subunit
LLTDFEANGSFADVAENVQVYDHEQFAWYVRATDLENDSVLSTVRYVDRKSYEFLKKTKLVGGEVLITKRGEIGKVYLFKQRTAYATVAPNLYLLKLNGKALPDFVFYYFKHGRGNETLRTINASTTLGALYKNDVKSIQLPLPTVTEQRAIATALTDVDALLSGLDALIAKKKAIKQGAMQQLLTGKKRLPGFGGEWEVKRLGEILQLRHGKPQHAVVKQGGKYPIIGTGGIMAWTDEYLCDKPSVMIGRKGTIDVPQYRDTPFWTVDTLFYTEVSEKANAKFLFYRFWLIDWYRYNESSGVPSMIASTVENIEIELPKTYHEQTAIATVLTDMDAEITALEARRAKTALLKQGMMQELLTGKTRLV